MTAKANYVKDIYKHRDGRYEIVVLRNGKAEELYYQSEDEAFEAYLTLCEEFYA